MWNKAVKINGADPDFHRRDLWNAITPGDYPEWELGVQLFDEAFAERFAFDVLDATKIIPEEEVPVRIAGRMVLDRVVDNFFAVQPRTDLRPSDRLSILKNGPQSFQGCKLGVLVTDGVDARLLSGVHRPGRPGRHRLVYGKVLPAALLGAEDERGVVANSGPHGDEDRPVTVSATLAKWQ